MRWETVLKRLVVQKTLKSQESQANIMVWVVFLLSNSGKSSKHNGLGCFLLSKVRKVKQIWLFGEFFVVRSQESQATIMVWSVFCYQKSGKSSKYNGLGWFFVIKSQESQANIMVWAVFCYRKTGKASTYISLGCFLLSQVKKVKQI